MEYKVTKMEIEEVAKIIDKYDRKCLAYYFGVAFGSLLMLISLVYYIMNPSIIEGVISLLSIGGFVVFLNVISIKKAKSRMLALQKDLDFLQKIYEKQIDL